MKLSFPPVADENTHVLILGSLPGEESLRQQKYYANPRNQFWQIMFEIFKPPVFETYEERLSFLKSKRIGLWDVIHAAEREGSLDIKIRNATPNDFASLLKQYPNIRKLIFNGRKAEKSFTRLVKGKQNLPEYLFLAYFPSTSPAHTSNSFDAKVTAWIKLKKLLKK